LAISQIALAREGIPMATPMASVVAPREGDPVRHITSTSLSLDARIYYAGAYPRLLCEVLDLGVFEVVVLV
jgi:hypothetical protein